MIEAQRIGSAADEHPLVLRGGRLCAERALPVIDGGQVAPLAVHAGAVVEPADLGSGSSRDCGVEDQRTALLQPGVAKMAGEYRRLATLQL